LIALPLGSIGIPIDNRYQARSVDDNKRSMNIYVAVSMLRYIVKIPMNHEVSSVVGQVIANFPNGPDIVSLTKNERYLLSATL
jgi:hypothetical protein